MSKLRKNPNMNLSPSSLAYRQKTPATRAAGVMANALKLRRSVRALEGVYGEKAETRAAKALQQTKETVASKHMKRVHPEVHSRAVRKLGIAERYAHQRWQRGK